jgi:hypothetical protein
MGFCLNALRKLTVSFLARAYECFWCFLPFCKKIVGNLECTLFWEDVWLGQKPIRELFPRLHLLTFSVNSTVADVFNEGWGIIHFRRVLFGQTARM